MPYCHPWVTAQHGPRCPVRPAAAEHAPKAAHPDPRRPPAAAPLPSPSSQLGTPAARGHRWPGDNFPGPGKQRGNLHLHLHFLIVPAGFLGPRLVLVSMAGSVRTPRTEGPRWSCHSLPSKAAGGAGWGHRGRGHRHHAPLAPGRPRGDPRAREEGGWHTGHRRFGDTPPAGLLDGGTKAQPPSPRGGSHHTPSGSRARAGPRRSPVPLSCYFQPAFHPAGVGCFPRPTSPCHFGTVLPTRLPAPARRAHPALRWPPGSGRAATNTTEALDNPVPKPPMPAQCHRAATRLRQRPSARRPRWQRRCRPNRVAREGPVTASHTCEGPHVTISRVFFLL